MNDKKSFSVFFIRTKDKIYLISEFPNQVGYYESIEYFLKSKDRIFILNKSDDFDKDVIKAYRMDTKDILGWGQFNSLKEYTDDELDQIKNKGKLDDLTIYKIID